MAEVIWEKTKALSLDCSTKGLLKAYLHYLDEKTLPRGSNNGSTPCPLSALNPGVSEMLKPLGIHTARNARAFHRTLMGSKSPVKGKTSALFKENVKHIQRR